MEPFCCDSPWLQLALTHRSVSPSNNERLEFLGDALLGLILAEEIYRRYPGADEGTMTLMRSRLANREFLADMAKSLELDTALAAKLSDTDRYLIASTNVLAGTFEACLAAVYLEFGLERLRDLIGRLYQPHWLDVNQADSCDWQALKSAKALLQEHLQKRGHNLPSYRLVRTEGEAHQLIFFVECRIGVLDIAAIGSGTRQRYAENHAAQQVYEILASGRGCPP